MQCTLSVVARFFIEYPDLGILGVDEYQFIPIIGYDVVFRVADVSVTRWFKWSLAHTPIVGFRCGAGYVVFVGIFALNLSKLARSN
ncbi:MAG: hypothetical protein CMD77_03700 [Gammaproteobacteria bacterium]|nr:hypothetical protein [Gammaproteobacteria bacterium]